MKKIQQSLVLVLASLVFPLFTQCQNFEQLSYEELDSLMMLCYTEGDYAEGVKLTTFVIEKTKEEFGRDTIYAQNTAWGGFFYELLGEYKKALLLYEETASIFKSALGNDDSEYAVALNNLANIHYKLGSYKKAEALYLEELGIREKLYGKEHPNYAVCINDLGVLYGQLENYSKAIEMHLEALRIRAKTLGTAHYDYASSLNNLAGAYENMGRLDKAEPLVLEALEVDKKVLGKDDPNYAVSLHNLATLYISLEQYEAAESLYLEALSLTERTLGSDHPYYARPLNNLATVYKKTQNYKKAEELFLKALAIEKKVYGTQHLIYLESLNNLGSLYKEQKQYVKAEKMYLEGLAGIKAINQKKSSYYALLLNNIAYLYDQTNRKDSALLFREEALDLYEKIYGKEHPRYIQILNNLTAAYIRVEEDSLAQISIKQILLASTDLNLSLNITPAWSDSIMNVTWISSQHLVNVISVMKNINDLLVKLSQNTDLFLEEQLIVANLGIQLLQKIKNTYSNPKDKLRILDKVNFWVLKSLDLLAKSEDVNVAFEVAEYNKSILLQESEQTKYAHSFGDLPDSLVRKENNLYQEQATLEAKLIEQRSEQEKDSLRIALNMVNVAINSFKTHIEETYPAYANLKYKQKKIDTQIVQAELNKETALIEYVLGDTVVYIFYIDQNNAVLSSHGIDKRILLNKVRDFRKVLSNYKLLSKYPEQSYKEYTVLAHWFYTTLLAPVLTNKEVKHLKIVTDGVLGHLPFEAFLVEAAPAFNRQGKNLTINYGSLHYLLDDYKVSYNYSAQLFLEKRRINNRAKNNAILGMASNYKLEIDSSKLTPRLPIYQRLRANLNSLPAAVEEVKAISEAYAGYFAFDEAANERNFKEKAADYSIIHLAMHGLLDNKAPILSSLAFTENGDSLENNFLQAYEISKMKLNANLVVLSACETGYGKFEQGNGIASLARAFMYAGASSLVVSLWQVSDYATGQIMQNLYTNLSKGMDKADALRQAKLDYINSAQKNLAHPAFWSPFIQIGNTEVIPLNPKRNYWIWGVGSLFLILIIGVLWKKRSGR